MDVESRRDLQLLEALEQESTITQRTLASRLGIALGLTNLYLKRLIRKGYVKCTTASPNRLVYSLTPRGVARKARLTYEFMKYSLDFYRDARRHLRRSLSAAVATRKRVAIYGTGDAAELVYLLVRDMGLELVAVFGPPDGEGGRFLGLPVHAIADHASIAYDVLVVAVLERPAGTSKLLQRSGVPPEKLLMLQPVGGLEAASTLAAPPDAP
ncbi:MAG TPA: winged helix-turn-helix transcriptional regulator [Vicinamibacterales bacterium]|nr:winged helix-turn-helix transcriptional regulator [Vicinamibacterales bacterium]